jgi:hypothetical protein
MCGWIGSPPVKVWGRAIPGRILASGLVQYSQRLQDSSRVDKGWRGRAGKKDAKGSLEAGNQARKGAIARGGKEGEECKAERRKERGEEKEDEGKAKSEWHARLPLRKPSNLFLLYELCGVFYLAWDVGMPNLDFQTMSNREGHETDFGRGNVIAIMEYRPER